MSIRLVQLASNPTVYGGRIALVEEPRLRLIDGIGSIFGLASWAVEEGRSIPAMIESRLTAETLSYDEVYSGTTDWKIMVPVTEPVEQTRTLVSGTGLTHLGSAKDRQSMHSGPVDQLTDSMKMFRWGLDGGKPAPGKVGIAPEWFYKGPGSILRAHNAPLEVPFHAEDGGEEAEIAGIYIIAPDGSPRRVGMCIGNEFSDHKFEKRNYLNLAGSKLRQCSIGPEIVIDPDFKSVPGKVMIERHGKALWSKSIITGEDEMCHSLANIEHHHFKFEAHRQPGDVHVHFYGAHSLSFGDGIELLDGDTMHVEFEGFGRPLRNPLRRVPPADSVVSVVPLSKS